MISRDLGAQINDFRDLTMKKLDTVMHMMAEQGVVELTTMSEAHVYTGWYRGSWIVSKNAPRDMVLKYKTGGFTAGHAAKGNRPTYRRWKNKRTGEIKESGTRYLPPSLPKQPGIGKVTREDKIVFSNAVPYAKWVPEIAGDLRRAMATLRSFTAVAARKVNGLINQKNRTSTDYRTSIQTLNAWAEAGGKPINAPEAAMPAMSTDEFMAGM